MEYLENKEKKEWKTGVTRPWKKLYSIGVLHSAAENILMKTDPDNAGVGGRE